MLTANKISSVSDSPGFKKMFAPGQLTVGIFFPIEAFERDEPTMRDQERLARRAEELGFAGLWFRDVPLRDPNFGDIGQVFDPWVYLGWIACSYTVHSARHRLDRAAPAASAPYGQGGGFS